ncbi:Crp/Fnr family transcriptional regulator [Streptomyces rhizosphaericola]|uniref:Crp/Fnr family transcriptional regulator n=1 Tax=Streptomyces rhizosphaericola TaxID=2564098 RepID=UPI0039F0C905
MNEHDFDEVPFWRSLGEADRSALLQAGTVRAVARDEILVRQEESSDHLLIVLQGCVKVLSDSASGYRAVLALRGRGDLLGEQAGADGRCRSATLKAVLPGQVLVVPLDRFRELAAQRAGIARARDRVLSGRLREADRKRLSTSEPVPERLAALLLELGERFGRKDVRPGEICIELHLSQEDLAGLVLSSLRTVSRVLEVWRRQMVVSTGRQSLRILDKERLQAMADGLDGPRLHGGGGRGSAGTSGRLSAAATGDDCGLTRGRGRQRR